MKAILVDDEQLALDYLEHLLEKIGGIKVVGKYNNFSLDDGHHPSLLDAVDVIFLDIEMPGVNGLELAERFLEINPSLSIVFVTAYNEYAVQAFALHVLDYLMKPVQVKRLRETVARLKRTRQHSPENVYVNGGFLNVKVCNELAFQIPDHDWEVLQFRTAKAKELFLYLLQHSDRKIRKTELLELLWPYFDEERALSQLYTAIYHIRKVLQPFSVYIGIHNSHGGYRLWTHNISLDIVLWENRIKKSIPLSIENIQNYETHMKLYTGPYLGSYDYTWAETEQHRLEQLWIKTAYQMAMVYEENGFLERAVEWYVQICDIRPEDEDSQFKLMQAYAKLGFGVLVSYHYKQLQQALGDLELEVSEDIEDWYLNWQS